METSDTLLKKANKEYKDQRGTIKQSHGLLRTMRKNSIRESLKLYAALALFAFVIAYVGFRRARYFVPEVVINSLPTLKTFGIGQHKVNSSADLPYLDEGGYHIPDIDPKENGSFHACQFQEDWVRCIAPLSPVLHSVLSCPFLHLVYEQS